MIGPIDTPKRKESLMVPSTNEVGEEGASHECRSERDFSGIVHDSLEGTQQARSITENPSRLESKEEASTSFSVANKKADKEDVPQCCTSRKASPTQPSSQNYSVSNDIDDNVESQQQLPKKELSAELILQENEERITSFPHRLSKLTTSIESRRRHDMLCQICTWSRERKLTVLFGCISAGLVCTIRLLIDGGNLTYLIHSIIILIDMILIHLFTYTPWLSISGEAITMASLLLFHLTHEKVFELLETTLIAAICSLHMIISRSKHWHREEQLEHEIEGLIGMEVRTCCPDIELGAESIENNERRTRVDHRKHVANLSYSMKVTTSEEKLKVGGYFQLYGQHFFEHFLDGAAGVMYTSFVGLIIDELIWYGGKK